MTPTTPRFGTKLDDRSVLIEATVLNTQHANRLPMYIALARHDEGYVTWRIHRDRSSTTVLHCAEGHYFTNVVDAVADYNRRIDAANSPLQNADGLTLCIGCGLMVEIEPDLAVVAVCHCPECGASQ